MTEKNLRDARLAQALQHMPDAHMQPDAKIRLAVLRHAQEAVAGGAAPAAQAPAKTQGWWRPTSPTAWGSALASVLVASFITLMWYGQPVPDANPEGLPAAQEVAVPAMPPGSAKPSPSPSPAPSLSPSPESALAEKKREVRALAPPRPTLAARNDKAVEIAERVAPVPLPSPAPAPPQQAMAPLPAPSLAPPVVAAAPAPAAPPAPVAFAKALTADSALAAPSKEMAATSAVAGASVAGRMQRNRAEAPPSASATVVQNGKASRLSANQATALLAALRALPYGVAEAYLQDATDKSTFTVQSAQGEVWIVGPHRVQFQRAHLSVEATQKSQSSMSPITDAQWQELRSLALPAP